MQMIGIFKGIKKILLIIWVFFSSFFFVNAIFHETGIIQLPEPEYKFTQGPIEDFFSSVLVLCFWLLVIAFGTYHLDPKRLFPLISLPVSRYGEDIITPRR